MSLSYSSVYTAIHTERKMKTYYFKCPSCNNDTSFENVRENTSNTGCLLYLFGGFIPLLIWGRSQRQKIMCSNCKLIFQKPPLPTSKLASFSMYILLIIIFSVTLTVYCALTKETPYYLFNNIDLHIVNELIVENVEAISIGSLTLLLSLILFCILTCFISNYKYRKKLSENVMLTVQNKKE